MPAAKPTFRDYAVAPGRTVSAEKDYGPGDIVNLPDDEGKRLQDLGFLVGDDGSVPVKTDGPAVSVEDGVQVKSES